MGRGDDKTARDMNKQNSATGNADLSAGIAGQGAGIATFQKAIQGIFDNNPYQDPTYLANVRSTASQVESGAQNAGNTKMEDYAQRTGENSSNVIAAEEEGARESARRQHGILTATAIDDQSKRQQQLMSATAMLGQIPGMYNGQIGAGTSLLGGSANNMTTMAGQGSWFDNLINAGISAAGAVGAGAAGCVVKGTFILLINGIRKLVEELLPGDVLLGADGLPENLISLPKATLADVYELICKNGTSLRCSGSHTLLRPMPGYVTASKAEGQKIMTRPSAQNRLETTTVERVMRLGKDMVYKLSLDRTHTYCSDSIWSLE